MLTKSMKWFNASRQRGFSLLEVLISVVVLSIGLLGMAALQINAMKNNQSSFERTQAVMLSYYMLDAMRANRADALAGNYNMAKTCAVPVDGGSLVEHDRNFWMSLLRNEYIKDGEEEPRVFFSGATTCGQITCVAATSICTVRIYWNDDRGTDGDDEQMFETSTRM